MVLTDLVNYFQEIRFRDKIIKRDTIIDFSSPAPSGCIYTECKQTVFSYGQLTLYQHNNDFVLIS